MPRPADINVLTISPPVLPQDSLPPGSASETRGRKYRGRCARSAPDVLGRRNSRGFSVYMTRSLEDVNHVVAMAEFLAHLGCRQLLPPSRKRDNLCFGAIVLTVHRRTTCTAAHWSGWPAGGRLSARSGGPRSSTAPRAAAAWPLRAQHPEAGTA